MGIGDGSSSQHSDQAPGSAFSKDTLSLEINGPNRPQLTLIDIPGLIQYADNAGTSIYQIPYILFGSINLRVSGTARASANVTVRPKGSIREAAES
ncbi:Dynamin family protein [Apiospora saccharicola]|uniref:Dynamin family protein n=1 Tax=Apiospora saccharicola TaxID=335842 RepID=A0ABR1VPW8_9PEZI